MPSVCEKLRRLPDHRYINSDGNEVIDDADYQAFLKRYPQSDKSEFITCIQELRAEMCLPPFHIDFIDRFSFTDRFLTRLEFGRDKCAVYVAGKAKENIPPSIRFILRRESPIHPTAQFDDISVDRLVGLPNLPITFSPHGGGILWGVKEPDGENVDIPVWVAGPQAGCLVYQNFRSAEPMILVDPNGGPVTTEMMAELANLIGNANQNFLKNDVNTLLWFPTDEHGDDDNMAILDLGVIQLAHSPKSMKAIKNTVVHELAHFRFREIEELIRSRLLEAEAELRKSGALSIFQEGTYGLTFSHTDEGLNSNELFANATVVLQNHAMEFQTLLARLAGNQKQSVINYAKEVIRSYGPNHPFPISFQ